MNNCGSCGKKCTGVGAECKNGACETPNPCLVSSYADADGDGYNSKGCGGTDCNDNNPSVWSLNSCGACAAQPSEIQCNGVDDDCSGGDYCPCTDSDGDTYYSNAVACGAGSSKQDCNDANININPGATDICGNGIDENCFAGDATCPCSDKDGDGYGSPGAGTCLGGSATDCNDNNAAINPGATDICGNGVDENCFAGDAKCSCGNGILDPGEVCE